VTVVEVVKQKAMQQPWHYRSETYSGIKNNFCPHKSWKSNTVTHLL